MRNITLAEVQPGMELARDLLDKDGNLLLEKGIKLTDHYIKRLHLFGLPAIYIIDPLLEDLKDNFLLSEALHKEALANLATLFQSQVSDIMMSARKRDMQFRRMSGTVDQLISEISSRCKNLVNRNICHLGDSIVHHSLNVCLLSIVIGLGCKLPVPALKELALGALLHDLGKIYMPNHILNKPGALTMEEMLEIRKHATYGHELVRLSDEVSPAAACAVQQHHERYNGSGYSTGLRGEQIHPFGRICAIADVFEAMTADRVYRPALSRKEVIEKMVSSGYSDFDLRFLQVFLHNIPVYPLGSRVILNTGEQGFVVYNNAKASLRPVIRITTDSQGQPLRAPQEIDLVTNQSSHIIKVLKT